jgi:RimJ/RimL family protein N-acetyltransferase
MAKIRARTRTLRNGTKVTLRTAAETDAPELLRLMDAGLEDGEGQIWERGEFRRTAEAQGRWVKSLVENERELMVVAEIGTRIVGTISFQVGKRRRYSHAGEFGVEVLKRYRNQGLGTALIKLLLAWGKAHPKIEKINLWVLASNKRAIAVYRKIGFVQEGLTKRSVKYAPGKYDDEIIMSCWVGK